MRTDSKMTKTEIKNHLIEEFGNEIQNQNHPSFLSRFP